MSHAHFDQAAAAVAGRSGGVDRAEETDDFTVRAALVALLAVAFAMPVGARLGVMGGLLVDTDSYTRLSRILASLEAGALLDHIPRDNGGIAIALHWTHLLDAVILVLALPLWPILGEAKAVHWAGVALSPLTAAGAAVAAMYAARILSARASSAMTAGVLAALSHSIVNYGTVGRPDHHVLLGGLGILAPILAYARPAVGPARPALWSGVASGLALWISPEILPFALLAWAVAIVADTETDGRFGRRATDFAGAFLAVLVVAMLIDPPSSGRWSVEMDRLSRPFVELAGLMAAVSLAARFLPAQRHPWPAAMVAGVVAALAVVPWLLLYPTLLQGAQGVFSAEGWLRIWRTNSEMRSPLLAANDIAVSLAVPLIVLGAAMATLLWHRRRPIDVLALAGTALLVYLACRYIRLTIYLQLGAAVAAALLLDHVASCMPAATRRMAVVVITFCLALAPYIANALVPPIPDENSGTDGCDARAVAPDLAPFAGRVVLTWLNDAPALLYFSKITVAAAPYHRAERRIFDVLDSFAATSFADRAPDALRRTGATAVLVCSTQSFKAGSLGEALAKGQAPAWLSPVPISPSSKYKLYVVR
ncbi:MAG: hypothetical protein KIT36_11525 [Alphaproteobacteria bacterium]|nr:hypothetical protein [Alphaproteobacteria bacterium]